MAYQIKEKRQNLSAHTCFTGVDSQTSSLISHLTSFRLILNTVPIKSTKTSVDPLSPLWVSVDDSLVEDKKHDKVRKTFQSTFVSKQKAF